jgi:hypothetical protein
VRGVVLEDRFVIVIPSGDETGKTDCRSHKINVENEVKFIDI